MVALVVLVLQNEPPKRIEAQHINNVEPPKVAVVSTPEVKPAPTPTVVQPVKPQPVATPAVSGSLVDWMTQAGIAPADFPYVSYIVSHESGGRYTAQNASGAYGLCQSLPAHKMASAGADYLTNPVTQLKWCNAYAQAKGGWYASYQFWVANRWW